MHTFASLNQSNFLKQTNLTEKVDLRLKLHCGNSNLHPCEPTCSCYSVTCLLGSARSSAVVLVICLNYWIKPLPFQCSCPNLSRQLSNLHSLRYSQYSFENLFFWYSTRWVWYTQCWYRGWWFIWFFWKFQQKIPKTRKLKEFLLKIAPSTFYFWHVDR